MARDGIDILTEMLKEMQQTHKVDDQQLESLKALKDIAGKDAGALGFAQHPEGRIALAPETQPAALNPLPMQGEAVRGEPVIAPLLAVAHKMSTDLGAVLAVLQKVSVSGTGGTSTGAGGKEPAEPKLKTPKAESGGGLMAGIKSVTASIGSIGEAFSTLMGPVGAVTGLFGQLVGSIQGFVEALAPAAILRFTQAMRDLQATLGVALEPLMSAATRITREFGSLLLPIMQQLRPIMQQLGQTVSGIVIAGLKALATVVQPLLPVLQTLMDLYEAFAPIQEAFLGIMGKIVGLQLSVVFGLINAAMKPLVPLIDIMAGALTAIMPAFEAIIAAANGLVQVFSDLLGPLLGIEDLDLSDVFDKLRDAATEFGAGLIRVVGTMLRLVDSLFGTKTLDSFISGIKNSLKGPEREDDTGLAAATSPTISTLDAFAKSVNTASLIAGGGEEDEEEEEDPNTELLEKSLDALEALKMKDPIKDLESKLKPLLEERAKAFQDFLSKKIDEAVTNLKQLPFDKSKELAKKGASSGLFGVGGMIAGQVFG